MRQNCIFSCHNSAANKSKPSNNYARRKRPRGLATEVLTWLSWRRGVGRVTDATSHATSGLSFVGMVSWEATWVRTIVCGWWNRSWKFFCFLIFPLRSLVNSPERAIISFFKNKQSSSSHWLDCFLALSSQSSVACSTRVKREPGHPPRALPGRALPADLPGQTDARSKGGR